MRERKKEMLDATTSVSAYSTPPIPFFVHFSRQSGQLHGASCMVGLLKKRSPFLSALNFLKSLLHTKQKYKPPEIFFPPYSRPFTPPIASLWDPEDVLKIGQVSLGVKCVADALTLGRQCRYDIAVINYQRASNVVLRLSRLHPSSPEVNDTLNLLARLLICNHSNHKDQVEAVVAKWRSQIRQFQAARREAAAERQYLQQAAMIYAHEVEAARQEVQTARQEAALHRQDIAIALRDVEIARRNTTIALHDTAVARQDADMARRETETARREINVLRLEAALNLEVRDTLAEQVLALRAARDGGATRAPIIEAPRPNPAPPQNQIERNATPGSPAARPRGAGSRRQVTVLVPMPTDEVDRSPTIEGDCSICLDRLGIEGVVRCEGRCQQRFHGNCMNAWLLVRRECPLWYIKPLQ